MNAAPGWYDDPSHPGHRRYWDGFQWTQHFQKIEPAGSHPPPPSAPPASTPSNLPKILAVTGASIVGFVLLLMGLNYFTGIGSAPDDQQEFVETVEQARENHFAAQGNEIEQEAIEDRRDAALCEIVSSGSFKDWTAQVEKVEDARGLVALEVSMPDSHASLSTRDDFLTNPDKETLIDPDSLLGAQVVALEAGQKVKVSGEFLQGSGGCVDAPDVVSPTFMVRFTEVDSG